MQDKFSIGPVNIVQLVGLTAKPRIASAQGDAAVRAADAVPPSAAAGLGDDLSQPLAEVAASYLNIKAAPVLGLSADPAGSHIALEAGVDRPIVDASASAPAIGPSASDNFLPSNNPVDRSAQERSEAAQPGSGAVAVPDAAASGTSDAPTGGGDLKYVFDGVDSFGDDQTLDFTIGVSDTPIVSGVPSGPAMISAEFDAMLVVSITDELTGFSISDLSVDTQPELPMTKGDLIVIDPQPSAADAIPVI
jgi:hypothetical protein